ATAYGLVSTTTPGPNDPPPPNGTIFDRLSSYGIPWTNYFTDLPSVAIIPATVKSYPANLRPIAQFYADCAAGTLPAYSLVDPDVGMTDVAGGLVLDGTVPTVVRAQGQDEENPQNIRYGEAFVAQVVNAVMASPAWDRTLLVWCYDEHGVATTTMSRRHGLFDLTASSRRSAPQTSRVAMTCTAAGCRRSSCHRGRAGTT
ncbi:MAG TPA: alkaline phosphatase family protein, partial [Mycobacteriales bacterium]|nr:alkaline phosphatase family protein [Mycobacteriales bacterium]